MLRKKESRSSNNWKKLNSWAFVRELAPHIFYIYQEEADNLLYPELFCSEDFGCAESKGKLCRMADSHHAQVGISPFPEVICSSPGLSHLIPAIVLSDSLSASWLSSQGPIYQHQWLLLNCIVCLFFVIELSVFFIYIYI